MSGRLTILPKKSYCPWSAENVERVLRDEREHREKTRAAAAKERRCISEKRWEQHSVEQNTNTKKKHGGYARDEHVNLFLHEEERERQSFLSSDRRRHNDNDKQQQQQQQQQQHSQSSFLHRSAGDKNRPFYLRDDKPFERVDAMSEREKKRMSDMDPMKGFRQPASDEDGIASQLRKDRIISNTIVTSSSRSLSLTVKKTANDKRHKDDGDNSSCLSSSSSEDSSVRRRRRRRQRRKRRRSEREHRQREERRSRKLDHRRRQSKREKGEFVGTDEGGDDTTASIGKRPRKSDTPNSASLSMEELRWRRLERESQERKRQIGLLNSLHARR